MFHIRAQTLALRLGVVAALLVAESHCLPAQVSAKQVISQDELALSLVVNQVAVLKLLNESSTIYSLHERELDVKTEELKSELQNIKETALQQFQNMATATLNEINARNEETRQMLHDVKETALNMSRQAAIIATVRIPECESSWSGYHWSCYKVFKTQVTNTRAKAYCEALGAHLATIGSEGENSFVQGLIERETYIGLSDAEQEGVYTWQDGSPFSYSRWASGPPQQPNNHDENEDCVVMDRHSHWWDKLCSESHHYICEKRRV